MKKVILFLLLVATIYVFYMSREADISIVPGSDGSADKGTAAVKQKVIKFSINGRTSKGVKQWHLEGTAAEIVDEKIYLEDLDAEAFGEKFTIQLTSSRGIYYKDRSEVELEGNVRVSSDDGTVLTMDSALWSQETKDISSDSAVRIERTDMVATGVGGRANSEKKTAMLLSDVTVKMEPVTLIKCSGPLDASFTENKAVFLNNVRVKDKDGELFSDMLTVYMDKDTGRIKEVIAEGNVKLVKGKSYTLCEKATYTDGTGSVEFVGKPRVVIAAEELESGGFGFEKT